MITISLDMRSEGVSCSIFRALFHHIDTRKSKKNRLPTHPLSFETAKTYASFYQDYDKNRGGHDGK